ncbi:MAG TPA: 2-dehydropantoate 2-reductase [Anaerolineales bacterium]|nr:2-dehydropantoate 2-reductase [Anaerolineales bacterium]
MSTPRLRVMCFGAGAIGTYIGGSLALAGVDLVFLEQPDAARELQSRGLRLDLRADKRRSAKEPLVLPPQAVIFTKSPEEALDRGPFDAAVFALKSFDTPQALNAIQPWAAQMPPIVCFSNGVENEEQIARVLGDGRVVAATVTSAIGRRAAGDIVLERLRGVGIYSGHPVSFRLLGSANQAGLNARGYPNAAAMKWSKMLTNLIANPTSAILNWSAAQVLAHPGMYRLEIRMLRECLAVMKAQRIPVVNLPGTPVRGLAAAVQLPPWISGPLILRAAGSGRGAKMPSFHIDLYSRRGKSEVGYLHGAVARFGEKLGVPTPINSLLTRTLQALTDGQMPLDRYAGRPEVLLADLARSVN